MSPRMPGVFALGSSLLAACGSGKDSDSCDCTTGTGGTVGTGMPTTGTSVPFQVTTTWTDDGGLPVDSSCGDVLTIHIVDPLEVPDWEFGMVESGPTGWSGEDCLNGYAGYAVCHAIGLDHTLYEVADCLPASVVPGSTTLFDASKEPYLTYYLADTTSCFVWGADAAYYASLACSEL